MKKSKHQMTTHEMALILLNNISFCNDQRINGLNPQKKLDYINKQFSQGSIKDLYKAYCEKEIN